MDVLPGMDQADSRLQPSRHFMAAQIKRVRFLPCAACDLSDEEQAAEGVPAALALWSGDAQVRTAGGTRGAAGPGGPLRTGSGAPF